MVGGSPWQKIFGDLKIQSGCVKNDFVNQFSTQVDGSPWQKFFGDLKIQNV